MTRVGPSWGARRPPESPSPGQGPPAVEGHPTAVYDFSHLDFDALWRGRDRTTALERTVVGWALDGVEGTRVLEIGPGGGRITPVLAARFPEYIGVDVTLDFVTRLARSAAPGFRYAAADVHHLPFVDASFDAVTLVRVFNFLVDPGQAVAELGRVVRPGGSVVLSYHPVPSLGTLHDDVRNELAPERPAGFRPVTLRREEFHHPRRRRVTRYLETAGLTIRSEYVTGIEDFRVGRWIPAGSLLSLARLTAPLSLLPHRFVSALRPGPRTPLPPIDRIVACARCRTPLEGVDLATTSSAACGQCGAVFSATSGVFDLR